MRGRPTRASILATTAVALSALLALGSPLTASALDTSQRSPGAIRTRWAELKPVYSGTPYSVAPSVVAPYSAGELNPAFLQDGLNAINYARFLAGLPDDVVLDASFTDRAQHGAVLLAAGTFAHEPPKPSNMAQAFYDLGFSATSRSNIGWGYASLAQFNQACMDDSDTGNIVRLGHRRWLLNPPLNKTGMGYADASSDTFVFDWSRGAAVAYDSVKWPCAGYFPVEQFGTSTPWSVTLNPVVYGWTAGRAGHTVTLTRLRDGRTWTFTSADTNTAGKYFNFETESNFDPYGTGANDCFVFRPDAATLGSYQVGDVFDVRIEGGITLKSTGAQTAISYRTQFMSQVGPTGPDVTAPVTYSDARASYFGSATIRLTPTDGGSGVATTYYRLDGGGEVAGTVVSTSTLGPHILAFWSVDASGNVETPRDVSFTVVPPPTPTVVSAPRVSPSRPRHGRTTTFTAYLAPGAGAVSGASTLQLYRYETKTVRRKVRGHWRRVRVKYWRLRNSVTMTPDATGLLTARAKPRYAGKWRARATFAGSAGFLPGTSGWKSFTVR